MLTIVEDKSKKLSSEVISKGGIAIIGNSKTTGRFTGIMFEGAKIRASSVRKCQDMLNKDLGRWFSNEEYYDRDVTNRIYSQFHFERQHMSIVVENDTIIIYSNLGKRHNFMFFPVKSKSINKSPNRLHQCAMSYRTENKLKNVHFGYHYQSPTITADTGNLFKIYDKKVTTRPFIKSEKIR